MKRMTALACAVATLGACTEPNPPTVDQRDIDRAFEEAERIADLPFTAPDDIPTGTVTYDGQIGANVANDVDGTILADMTMIVGFSSNTITGNVTDINLLDIHGIPDQRFDGSLSINGIQDDGDLDAVASGTISGVDALGLIIDADMDLDLNGALRDDRAEGDAVFGDVDGRTQGDFFLDIEGVFFGEAR